jgi:acyl transferase domain-containing protein
MSAPTEERLREALGALADTVEVQPGAYERAQAAWRRRERRRRRLVVAVAVLVVAVADAAGLWALNRAGSGAPVVFDGPAPVRLSEPREAAPRTPLPDGVRTPRQR